MHDLPESVLLQQANAIPKSGQELEVMGKHAASLYTSGRCSCLTEAVIETVKEASLSPEQVRRVVEFANVDAYLQEFKKEGQEHRFIEFEQGPADPSEVLKDLNDGGGGTVFDTGSLDYDEPPPDVAKTSSANMTKLGMIERPLQKAFAVEDPPLPYENPMQDSMELRDKLAAVYDHLTSKLVGYESMFADLTDSIYDHVKQAALTDTSLGQVVQALSTLTDEPELIKHAFHMITPRLIEEGVFRNRTAMAESLESLDKTAMVNSAHPLISDFNEWCECLVKMAQARKASEEVASNLDTLNTFVKEAGAAGKAWEAAKYVQRPFTEAAGKIHGAAGGGLAAKALAAPVIIAPATAAAMTGESVRQRVKVSPTAQKAKRLARGGVARLPFIDTQAKRELMYRRMVEAQRGGR
jgi:hypothetical protein